MGTLDSYVYLGVGLTPQQKIESIHDVVLHNVLHDLDQCDASEVEFDLWGDVERPSEGGRAFKCNVCMKIFPCKSELKMHYKTPKEWENFCLSNM